ncbi:MAG: nitrilase-related carbon-nitrogen hydrolase [Acidobacteriota bacterium]
MTAHDGDAPLRIALVQQAVGADRAANLARALDAIDAAADAGARLVVFPELAIDRFFPAVRHPDRAEVADRAEPIPGPITEAIAARAGANGVVVVFNQYERGPDGRMFDTSPVFDADGTLLGVTRMVHIVDMDDFHETDVYDPGDALGCTVPFDAADGADGEIYRPPVYRTAVGTIGVAICYDRHFPEYLRALALAGADLVLVPQAGALGEWPEGMFEAEMRVSAFHNGVFVALCNRVGVEDALTFAGGSFVSDPEGRIVARGAEMADDLVIADLDLHLARTSTARRLFLRDRRPDLYRGWLTPPSR